MANLKDLPAWKALEKHCKKLENIHMRDLFAEDPGRFGRFSMALEDLFFDYSKNRMTEKTLSLLVDLAEQAGLSDSIKAMFAGEKINITENRSVLHVALRNRSNRPIMLDGKSVMLEINQVLEKMRLFSEAVRSGSWVGSGNKPIQDVVNIGIGGSDLGPRMVTSALDFYAKPDLCVHFVSNVDGTRSGDGIEGTESSNYALYHIIQKFYHPGNHAECRIGQKVAFI